MWKHCSKKMRKSRGYEQYATIASPVGLGKDAGYAVGITIMQIPARLGMRVIITLNVGIVGVTILGETAGTVKDLGNPHGLILDILEA